MIVVIDNYDSFVYNLARYFALAGAACRVIRNDAVTVAEIVDMNPQAIVLSPGPRAPKDAGICVPLIRTLGPRIPIFGVCLGHQAINEAYGGQTVRAQTPMHGKASAVTHDGSALFAGMPNPMTAGRYHSLTCDVPNGSPLIVTAHSEDGTVMALRHGIHPVYGVQFHPESILTENGLQIVRNFLDIARAWNASSGKIAA